MKNIQFIKDESAVPLVKLTMSAICFNEYLVKTFNYPEFVNLGLDIENKILAVKVADKSDTSLRAYEFSTEKNRGKKVSIMATKLRYEIAKLIDTKNRKNNLNFIAEFDVDKKMVLVDFKKDEIAY